MASARGKKKPAIGGVAETDGSGSSFDVAVAAVRGAPEDADAWARLEEVGAERASDVAALYRELCAGDAGVAAQVGARAVEFHDEWGEEPAAIEGLVRRVLAVSPGEAWAFDRLKLTYSTDERWGDLLEVFDLALAAASGDDVRATLLDDAVKIAKDFARDFERAIGYAERLLVVHPDDRTRGTLERLYERCERHEALVNLYREQLPALDVGAAQGLRKKIASKWLGLGDQERAFSVIEEMLAIDVEDAGAFELLERIFGTPSRSIPPPSSRRSLPPPGGDAVNAAPIDGSHETPRSTRQRAALLLKPKYLAEGRARELVRVLEVELAVARTDEERALAYRELAALQLDTLRDDAGALDALSALVVLEPADPLHRKALAHVAGRLGRHDRRAKVLVAAADRVTEAEARAALLTEAAEVCRGPLDAAGRAIDLYQRVAALEERSTADRLATLRELSALLGKANRLAEKCEALERIAAMETDPDARRAALGEVARIAQEDFGDADRSARAWQSRLADDPADLEAIDGVRPVLRSQGRLRDLAGVLERAAAAVRERAPKGSDVVARLRELLQEAASISEDELHDAIAATRCFEALLVHAPDDEPVLERLAGLYRSAGRRSDLLALRQRQLALASDPARVKERVRLRLDIAGVHKELGEGDARIAALEENLRDDPRDEASASELGDALAAAERFGHLVSLWEAQAREYGDAGDRTRATTLWRRAAVLAEERLADPRRAIEDHEHAGDDPASLDALARLYEADGNLVASASALERLVRETAGEERIGVQLRLATALVAAGRREAARRALEQAAEETPDARLRSLLAEIYRVDEAWESLAQHLVREVELVDTDAERVELLRAAAELHLEKRGDAEEAVPLLERAATLSGQATPIVLLLAPALVTVGRAEDAVMLLRARVEAFGVRRPKERALVHLALARALSAAREPTLALAELDVAVKIDPVNLRIRRALADAAADAGELESAQRTYRALLLVLPRVATASSTDGPKPEITRSEVLLCLSAVAERLGDPADAAECEESALAAARESEWERSALERELLARGRHARLAEMLTARVEGLDPEQAAAACDQLVRLHDDHLERPEEAFAWALRAVSLTPASSARHAVASELGKRVGRSAAYLDLVREQSERARGPEVAFELFAMLGAAEESAERLDDAARAFERAERAALELEPHEIGGRRLDHAWASLDRVYAKLGDDEARAPVLLRRLGASEARGEPPAKRAEGLYALAEIELASGEASARGVDTLERALAAEARLDAAESALKRTLERGPGHERAARMYVTLSRAPGRERSLIDALSRLALIEGDRSSLIEAAAVALTIEDRATAESLLRKFIDLAEQRPEGAPRLSLLPPSDAERARVAEALLQLARLRGQAGDVRENGALKERAAARLGPERAKPILLEVAALAAGPLGDLPRAARIYSTLHRDAVGDRAVWEPLLEIHRARGDVEPFAALVEEIAPLLEDRAERARLRLEEATLLVRAAAVPSRRPPSEVDEEWGPASPIVESARASIAPARDTPSDVGRAIAALWLVLDDDPSSTEATELLGTLLERDRRLEDLAKLLARRIEHERARQDGPAIASLATRLGSVLEELGRDEDAQSAYRTAVEWDPENRAVHRALLRLSEKRQEPADLAKATEALLLLEVGVEAERLALRLVSLLDAQGDAKAMRRALEIGIERSPSSQALRSRLVELFEDSAEWQDLAAYHIASSETRGTTAERVEALREAATVMRRELSDPSGAAKALERAFALAPHDRNLLLSLVNAWSSAGEPERAAYVVDRTIEASPDEVALLHVRAVLREASGELDGALADRERIHELSGGDHGAELAALLERMVAEPGSEPKVEAGRRARLAEVLLGLGRGDDTIAELEAVLRLDPSRRDVRAGLAALYGEAGRVDEAIGAYALLLAIEQGEELVRDTLAFADLCVQADRLDALLPALERARSEAPGDAEIKQRLHAAYAALGEKRTLAGLLLEDAAVEADPAAKFKLLADAARLLVDPSDGDPGRAIKVLSDARALRPDDPEIGLLHADALKASGKAGEALDLLETLVVTQKRRTKLRGAMHRRIAQLYAGMGARTSSLQALVKAMDDDPHDAPLAMEVGLQAVELGDPEAAARAFRTITLMKTVAEGAAEGASATTKATAFHHLARLADAQGDLRKARMLAEKAVSESPSHEEAKAYRDALKKRG